MDIDKNTTVAISATTNTKLNTFCTKNKITKKDFITISLRYFERYGIDPNINESPSIEIEKIKKRIDSLISFFKFQEKEIINPTFASVVKTEERLSLKLQSLDVLKDLEKNIDNLFLKYLDQINMNSNKIDTLTESVLLLSQTLESTNKKNGLNKTIKDLFSK